MGGCEETQDPELQICSLCVQFITSRILAPVLLNRGSDPCSASVFHLFQDQSFSELGTGGGVGKSGGGIRGLGMGV